MSDQENLVPNYDSYQQDYNGKCSEWRSEPVSERKCNDVACVAVFLVLFGGFLGVGAYYIGQKNSINLDNDLYVSQYGGEIAGCLGISIVLSFLYIILIKLIPKVMVYTLIGLSMGLLLIAAVVGILSGAVAIGIPFLIIFLVYALVLYCMRRKIALGITLIKVATQFLTEKWGIFVTPLIKIALNILFTFFWIYTFNCIIATSDDKVKRNEDNTTQSVFAVLWFFIWLFFSFLFYYIMVFTVAVACSFWYYRVEGKHYLPTAYKWLFTSAFGSIVFGSFLIAIITFARMIVDSQRKSNKNIAVAVCLCLISCCLRNLESLLKILNHNAVIVMSVTGESYINSAKTTIGLLSRFLPLMAVTDVISSLLVFWGVVLVAGLSGIISYLWLSSHLDGGDLALVMFISILGSIMVSILVFSVLIEAISSVFIFYCFDVKFKEMGYSSNNMPAQINEALGNYELNDPNKPN